MITKKHYLKPVSETVGIVLETRFLGSTTDKDDFPGINNPTFGIEDIDWGIF